MELLSCSLKPIIQIQRGGKCSEWRTKVELLCSKAVYLSAGELWEGGMSLLACFVSPGSDPAKDFPVARLKKPSAWGAGGGSPASDLIPSIDVSDFAIFTVPLSVVGPCVLLPPLCT